MNRPLVAVLYFMLCGYLFAKYDGDRLLAEWARKGYRALILEARQITAELEPGESWLFAAATRPPEVIRLPVRPDTPAWWEARPHE